MKNKKYAYELDLLDFQGKPIELSFRSPRAEMGWLFEETDGEFAMAEASEFRLDLEASLIDTTVRLTGQMRGEFQYTCGRCLEPRAIHLDSEVEFVLMSRPSWQEAYEGVEEVTLSADDLDVSYYEGDLIDLRPIIREAVLLELPGYPQCPPSQREACDEGFAKNVGEATLEANRENEIDLRWTALRNIKLGDKSEN